MCCKSEGESTDLHSQISELKMQLPKKNGKPESQVRELKENLETEKAASSQVETQKKVLEYILDFKEAKETPQEQELTQSKKSLGEVAEVYETQIQKLTEQLEQIENVKVKKRSTNFGNYKCDSECKRKRAETQLQEMQVKITEGGKIQAELSEKLNRLVELEAKIEDSQKLLHEEVSRKLDLSTRLKQMED
ncbi:myosin-9-like [Eleutherodactylus coqui]|uniref:myosin-9-like n=1 Tax=Eleutherodactylus coqui TaxID=57060 RepID=UPI003462348B